MRVKFAHTVRHHMQDATLFSNPGTHVWTTHDAAVADELLRLLRVQPSIDASTLATLAATECPQTPVDSILAVWERMQTFPYIFEVSAARNAFGTISLQGKSLPQATADATQKQITRIQYQNWHVALKDFTEFRLRDKMSRALFEHFAQLFREKAPSYMKLSIQADAQKRNLSLPTPDYSSTNESFVCYPYYSPVGYLSLYVLKRTRRQANDDPEQTLSILQHADIYDEHTRATTSCLRACFPTATVHYITLPQEQASDFALLASYAAATTTAAYVLPNELLSRLRDNALTYTSYLEQTAATAQTSNSNTC